MYVNTRTRLILLSKSKNRFRIYCVCARRICHPLSLPPNARGELIFFSRFKLFMTLRLLAVQSAVSSLCQGRLVWLLYIFFLFNFFFHLLGAVIN